MVYNIKIELTVDTTFPVDRFSSHSTIGEGCKSLGNLDSLRINPYLKQAKTMGNNLLKLKQVHCFDWSISCSKMRSAYFKI